MADFIEKYKKNKKMGTFAILWISLVLALGINFFVLDWTEIGKNLKASILDVNNVWNKADFFLEKKENSLIIRASKTMEKPISVSISFAYDPEILAINSFVSDFGDVAILWETGTWYDTIMISMDGTKDIVADSVVMEITTNRKENTSTQMNMIDANFIDIVWENYILTTSWITF